MDGQKDWMDKWTDGWVGYISFVKEYQERY